MIQRKVGGTHFSAQGYEKNKPKLIYSILILAQIKVRCKGNFPVDVINAIEICV